MLCFPTKPWTPITVLGGLTWRPICWSTLNQNTWRSLDRIFPTDPAQIIMNPRAPALVLSPVFLIWPHCLCFSNHLWQKYIKIHPENTQQHSHCKNVCRRSTRCFQGSRRLASIPAFIYQKKQLLMLQLKSNSESITKSYSHVCQVPNSSPKVNVAIQISWWVCGDSVHSKSVAIYVQG